MQKPFYVRFTAWLVPKDLIFVILTAICSRAINCSLFCKGPKHMLTHTVELGLLKRPLAFEIVPVFCMGLCGRPGITWGEQHLGKLLMYLSGSNE